MFRRRPFRRPARFRRRPPRTAVPPRLRRALVRANRLMADGRFDEAAGIFGRLSEEAKRRGMLGRAADLALQASRAHLAADGVDAALERAKEGLRLLVQGGRTGRVPLLLSKMTAALRERGYDAQADHLEQEAARALGEAGLSLEDARGQAPRMPARRGTLPAKCSGCGAPLVPDEVEWHDPQTAECPYCGTLAKAAQ